MKRFATGLAVASLLVTFCEGSRAQQTARLATVKSDLLPVYARMSTASKVLRTLKKGEQVSLDLEVVSAGAAWCGVREPVQGSWSGYVLCNDLEREPRPTFRILDETLIGRWETISDPVNTDMALLGWLQVVVPGIHAVMSFRADGTFSMVRRVFGGDQPSGEWEEVLRGTYNFVDKNHIEIRARGEGVSGAEILALTQTELRLRWEDGKTTTLTRLEETSPNADRTPATHPDEDKSRGQATVTVDASTVHSQASASSKMVKTLKKGEVVAVDFEIAGAGGTWCSVKESGAQGSWRGYVLCKDLARPERPPDTSAGGMPGSFPQGATSERQTPAPAPTRKARQEPIGPRPYRLIPYGALIEAIQRRDPAAVKKLLAQGVDPNSRDGYGHNSALCWAAYFCEPEIVRLLVASGADVNDQKNTEGVSPLMKAVVFCSRIEAIRLLLSAGADVNAQDTRSGLTALMHAARLGYVEAVKALLDAGASVEITDKEGRDALYYSNSKEVTTLLETGGRGFRTR